MANSMKYDAFAAKLVKINNGNGPETTLTRKELAAEMGLSLAEVTTHVCRIRSVLDKAGAEVPEAFRVQDEHRGRKPGASASDLLAIAAS